MNSVLRHIKAVLETGSVAGASRKIFVSQPAISQFIHRLEQEYGITIFDRSTSPWTLTEEGAYLVQCQERMESIDRECRLYFSERNNLKTGEIIIGSTAYRTATLLNPVLAVFKKRYPNIIVKIMEGTTEEIIDFTRERAVDCCFGITSMLTNDLESIRVFRENVLIAVSAEMSCVVREKRSVRQGNEFPLIEEASLDGIPFIIMKRGQVFHTYFETLREKFNLNLPIALETQSILTVPALIATGIGCALVPSTIIPDCADSNLKLFEIADIIPPNDVSIAWIKGKPLRQTTKAFIEIARAELLRLPFNRIKETAEEETDGIKTK